MPTNQETSETAGKPATTPEDDCKDEPESGHQEEEITEMVGLHKTFQSFFN